MVGRSKRYRLDLQRLDLVGVAERDGFLGREREELAFLDHPFDLDVLVDHRTPQIIAQPHRPQAEHRMRAPARCGTGHVGALARDGLFQFASEAGGELGLGEVVGVVAGARWVGSITEEGFVVNEPVPRPVHDAVVVTRCGRVRALEGADS